MTITGSGIKNTNSAELLNQAVEVICEQDALDLVAPKSEVPSPKSDSTKSTKNMKGAFCQSFIEKTGLQTAIRGLGLYALWNNRNLLSDGINAVRSGADYIATQTHIIGLEDSRVGGDFYRNPFFKKIIEENVEQESFYNTLLNTTENSDKDSNLFSTMETEAVREFVEQSFFDDLMLSDFMLANQLETKFNNWLLEVKKSTYLNEIDELKDDIEWLENEISELGQDINDYQQQIKDLTQQGLETRSKFVNALNQFDQFHRRIDKLCSVLLKIPVVKKIDAVQGFCNASDEMKDILSSSRDHLQNTKSRRLGPSEDSKDKYTSSWPPLMEKSNIFEFLQLLFEAHPSNYSLSPFTAEEYSDITLVKNVTSVLESNEQQAKNETQNFFQELELHLNNFTETALNNFTALFDNNNSTSKIEFNDKLNELLNLQYEVHAEIEPVLKKLAAVENKFQNAGTYLALAAVSLVYTGLIIAQLSRHLTVDGRVIRPLDNALFNPKHLFSLNLGRAFQKVFSHNLIYRQEALQESIKQKEVDSDIESRKLNSLNDDSKEQIEKIKPLKKLSAKQKTSVFGRNLIESTIETIFSAGFLFVVAGRILDNILKENRNDIKDTTTNTNIMLKQNSIKASSLISEIQDISKLIQEETRDKKIIMSQAHEELKVFNDETLPDEIRRFTQDLVSDSSNEFSPEFKAMISSPEFSDIILTAYKPDDDFINTLNAFEKFNNKLASQNGFTIPQNTNNNPADLTLVDPFEEIESHYANSTRTISEPPLPNNYSFGVGSDIAVIAIILAIRTVGNYVMETRDLNKSLDKDMISTHQSPLQWLSSRFREINPYLSAVTDAGLTGKFLSKKYKDVISDPFAIFQQPYSAHKKDDDIQASVDESDNV